MVETFLELVKEKAIKKNGVWLNKYKCICGNINYLQKRKFETGHTKSCGCKRVDLVAQSKTKHDLSKHPLFKIWANMIAKCYSENSQSYKKYGALGVRICDEWRYNFKNFYDWAIYNGWEKGLQIDKDIKARKLNIPPVLYSPELCSIVTNKQNANCRKSNKIFCYNGELKTISELADIKGINQKLMRYRVFKWGVDEAMNRNVIGNIKNIICTTNGKIYNSLQECISVENMTRKQLYRCLKMGKEFNGLNFKYLNN